VVINGNNRTLRLQSPGKGSIIRVESGVTLTLRDITLQGNSGNNTPLVTVTGGTLILDSVVIKDNANTSGVTTYGGGASVNGGGTLRMKGRTTVTGNTADNGGGVAVQMGNLFIGEDTTISLNHAHSFGGGIYVGDLNTREVFISSSSIRENIADTAGGGIYATDTVTMNQSSVTGNRAQTGDGGGVYFSASSAKSFTMTQGSIVNNAAGQNGGGVYAGGYGGVIFDMQDVGFASNTAQSDGAGVYLGNSAILAMRDRAKVAQSQKVWRGDSNTRINIIGTLTGSSSDPVANIDGPISSGAQVLTGNTSGNYQKFWYNGQPDKFDSAGKFK
jgi:predicted outer membrane repeat protein